MSTRPEEAFHMQLRGIPYSAIPRASLHIRKTLSLLFILFLLATSRKSTDSGKYHLLEKRNPFYFLAYYQ
jgi:hypothetical protein